MLVRTCGILGMFGSVTIMLTDWVGWTKKREDEHLRHDPDGLDLSPLAQKIFIGSRGISAGRRRWSAIIGAIAMFPTALGFVPTFYLLQPAGILLAFSVSALLAGSLMGGTMGHAGMGMINLMFDEVSALSRPSLAFTALSKAINQAIRVYLPITLISVLVLMASGSFLFSYTVFFELTHYPLWMGFLNVFLIMMFFQSRILLPYSIARWAAPACVHLFAMLPFITLSTLFAWEGF